MRVIVPATTRLPAVEDALRAAGTHHLIEYHDVTGSDRAYFDLLSSLWAAGQTFGIVEHDIVIDPNALDYLAMCPHDWCGYPHDMGEYWGVQYGLGCVKFTDRLIARNPDAMIRVGVMSDGKHPKRHWCRLDAWLQGVVLPHRGEVKHKHPEQVGHLGSGCSHGCVPAGARTKPVHI